MTHVSLIAVQVAVLQYVDVLSSKQGLAPQRGVPSFAQEALFDVNCVVVREKASALGVHAKVPNAAVIAILVTVGEMGVWFKTETA